MFGAPQQSTASTGFGTAGGFGQQPTTAFGSSSSAFKPAGGFGATQNTFGSTPQAAGGGMFGSTNTSQANQSFGAGGGFGATTTSGFGTNTNTGFGGATAGGFGAAQQVNGTTVKFQPVTGSDTMMKSGVQQNISTRHQVKNFTNIPNI